MSIANTRLIYHTHYLKLISDNYKAFDESYHTTFADEVQYLPGADREHLTETGKGHKAWEVFFKADAGTRHIVITGARFVYPSQTQAPRALHIFSSLAPNEEAYCYPNTAGDVIEELIIMVESESLPLRSDDTGREAGVRKGSSITFVPSSVFMEKGGSPRHRTAVARFRDIGKDDVACLKVNF